MIGLRTTVKISTILCVFPNKFIPLKGSPRNSFLLKYSSINSKHQCTSVSENSLFKPVSLYALFNHNIYFNYTKTYKKYYHIYKMYYQIYKKYYQSIIIVLTNWMSNNFILHILLIIQS